MSILKSKLTDNSERLLEIKRKLVASGGTATGTLDISEEMNTQNQLLDEIEALLEGNESSTRSVEIEMVTISFELVNNTLSNGESGIINGVLYNYSLNNGDGVTVFSNVFDGVENNELRLFESQIQVPKNSAIMLVSELFLTITPENYTKFESMYNLKDGVYTSLSGDVYLFINATENKNIKI